MRKLLLISLFLGLFASTTSATHMSGGEIYWECIGPNQYRITMVIYRDCFGINVDPSYTLQVQSPCGNTTMTVTTPGGVEISQLCDIELPNSTCNGGTLPGIQQYIYTGTITLPPCNFWTISYTNIFRNAAIVNLTNPGAQRTYIRATINTAAAPCNDSPQFTNTAIPYVCLGYPITYSFGAYDPESDSLSYQLIPAMGIAGGIGLGDSAEATSSTRSSLGRSRAPFAVRHSVTRVRMRAAHVAIGLILAGGIGNLYDRIVYGAVRDFLHMLPGWSLPNGWAWPGNSTSDVFPWVFNVADMMLLAGMALFIIVSFREDARARRAEKLAEAASAAPVK